MRLQEVIIQSHHGGMDSKTIKRATLVLQAVHAFGAQALKGIAPASGCRTRRFRRLETGELALGKLDLGGGVQPLEDHITVRNDLVYEVLDGGVLFAWEEGRSFAQLDAFLAQVWRWCDKRLEWSIRVWRGLMGMKLTMFNTLGQPGM